MRDHPEKEYFVDYLIIFRIKIKIYNISQSPSICLAIKINLLLKEGIKMRLQKKLLLKKKNTLTLYMRQTL